VFNTADDNARQTVRKKHALDPMNCSLDQCSREPSCGSTATLKKPKSTCTAAQLRGPNAADTMTTGSLEDEAMSDSDPSSAVSACNAVLVMPTSLAAAAPQQEHEFRS
jgi:hypothetical protein